jgi:hypothetical protein
MPRRKVTPDPTRLPALPLTPELTARFRALDAPTETEQPCNICHQGRDVPKTAIRNRLVCVVCSVMLGQMTPLGREKALLLGVDPLRRLPYYRAWFQHPDRATLHLKQSQAA